MWRNANWFYEGEEPSQKPGASTQPSRPRVAVIRRDNRLFTTIKERSLTDTQTKKLKKSPTYPSLLEFHVTFHISLLHRSSKTKAGYILAYTIDRSPTSTWKKDLLSPRIPGHRLNQRPMVHHDPSLHPNVEEIHMMMQNIYHQETGGVREEFSAHADDLGQEKLHFIAEFQVSAAFRGKGFAQKCLKGYISSLLPNLPGNMKYEGAVTLSPAGFLDVRLKMLREKGKERVGSWRDVEGKLIESYGKSGFEVWCRSEERFARQGGITIMGRRTRTEGEKNTSAIPKASVFDPEIPNLLSLPSTSSTLP
ncbi:uncharacterized protein MYCFIDRAFT_204366 [Pseudocercospora fijiensis CIRAD86]|uniref:Uncharacterized protein n=1 Tax=Pseudocercospora fijiensis (strain CIRAD86) TaxID=383855 RepID=M3ARZ6_PSEFD|nr:uncharacterized protein MYCFIDRAFT_204366 [Pseudocercospora fijiensis CIRAD86]EME79883.1 hypothetical protein MYCFIDRAFT_204366 [Pseudocercospora fijiensis CIRAD86]